MTTACVVVAGGRGERLAAGLPKAFVELAGRTLLDLAIERVLACHAVEAVVVVVPADRVDAVSSPGTVVAGGTSRRESVARGLAAVPAHCDVVLVHDAARCLAPPSLVARVVAAVRGGAPAVVPVMPIPDTLKHVEGDRVLETVDRWRLRAVQTPQGFARDVLCRAHAEVPAGHPATDDASLVESLGVAVTAVEGDQMAFKITTPLDLDVARALLVRGR